MFRVVTEAPEHQEEQAIRLLGALLSAVWITEDPDGAPFFSADEMSELIGRLIPAGSPGILPTLEEVLAGSPAIISSGSPGIGPIPVHPSEAEEVLSAAWRMWITEVRPRLANGAAGCDNNGENCVLLARLDFSVTDTGNGPQVDGPVAIDESDRPWLVQTRVLQEVW